MIEVSRDEKVVVVGPPPAATLRALAELNTKELREVHRFAESRVRVVRYAGCAVPKSYAAELVHDAITSTWLGLTAWAPARYKLVAHLCRVIRNRTAKEARRRRRFPHIALHVALGDTDDEARIEHALSDARHGNGRRARYAPLVARVVHELSEMVKVDADAHALLDCWAEGVIQRDDVIARAGVSASAYKGARERLLTAARNLPHDLCQAAFRLFRAAN